MKKTVTVAALLGVLTLAGIQAVSAHDGRYYGNDGNGRGYCGNYDADRTGISEKEQAVLEKFKEDTSTLRKDIVVKRSELNALMRQNNPDETKVAKLTGELYDLETDLDKKAEAAEIDAPFADRHGPGMMQGYGWRGGHMMNW